MVLWIFKHKFFCKLVFSILLGIYLGVEFLGHKVTFGSTFWETVRLFSKGTIPFHSPTSNVWETSFSRSLPVFVIICLYYFNYPSDMKWHVMLVLICLSLMANDVECIFMCLWTCLFNSSAYFKNWVAFLLLNCESFYIVWLQVLYQKYDLQIFPSILWDIQYFLDILWSIEVLILMKSNLFIFSFVTFAFDMISNKLLPNPWSQRFASLFSKGFIVFGSNI